MNLTVSYDYYRNTFKGELNEEFFDKMLPKAIDQIEMLLCQYPEEITDNIKKAICYAIDYEYGIFTGDAGLTSETEGDHSWTRSHSATAIQGNRKQSIIIRLLARDGLYDPKVKIIRKCIC